jgi:low affinity Fe/Cu permease
MNIPEKEIKHPRIKIVRQPIFSPDSGTKRDSFHKVSQNVSNKLGSPMAFGLALLLIVCWILTGPIFGFSDTWQLVINTTTTIVTFLMVFAIQNTQNRDAKAMQLKLNELINSSRSARTEFVDIEDLTDTELNVLQGQFKDIHDKIHNKQPGGTS